jgi:phospholipid/cholesterol/gamma-HCH transport system permease protein
MAESSATHPLIQLTEETGRGVLSAVGAVRGAIEEIGYAAALFGQSMFWLVMGRFRRQPVRLGAVVAQSFDIGVRAVPIGTVVSMAIGLTLAMQGIDLLSLFGAQSQVVVAVALSVVREFSPLIMGILIAGRSGSALTARLAAMRNNQEIDALRAMGINPVRFLVVPALIAMLIMVPLLTFWSDVAALTGAALYSRIELGMTLTAYADGTIQVLSVDHIMHGIGKAFIFGGLIALIAVVNGLTASAGPEGVGRATTRTVVISIAAIIITDMLFIFVLTRGVG